MRSKVVKVMMAQKSVEDRKLKSRLQLFADDGDSGDATGGEGSAGGDDGDDSGDGDGDDADGAKKYTDEEVNALIERKFAEWQKKHEKQQAKQDEAHEMEELRKQVNDLQKKETMSKMSTTARAMLSAKGITVDDALVGMMISEDADETKNAVDAFIAAFQKAVSDAVKDALKGEAPKAGGASGLTRDQIMKVKDRAERQRLINENMHLFK